MNVEIKGGSAEISGPVRFAIFRDNDSAIQVTEDRIDIYEGLQKVGEIEFESKRDLNRFFANRGIEKRR